MFDYFEYREKTFTWSLGRLRCLKCKRFDLVSAQASFTVMCTVVFVNVVDQNVDLGMCADSRLFIKCLLIVLSCSIVFVVSPLVFSSCCVFDFLSLDSGTGRAAVGFPLEPCDQKFLIFFFCVASLSIIYFGFDSSGRCRCSDMQVFLISTVVEDGSAGEALLLT